MTVVQFRRPADTQPAYTPDWEYQGRVGDGKRYTCQVTRSVMVTILVRPGGVEYWVTGGKLDDRARMRLAAALSGVGRPDGQGGVE